jgi:hypothetical protein
MDVQMEINGEQQIKGRKLLPLLILILLFCTTLFSGCVSEPNAKRNRFISSGEEGLKEGEGSSTSSIGRTIGVVNDIDGEISGSEDNLELFNRGQAEIRYVIDPFDGTYQAKTSIPKNFTGLLYLSGLNITSLADRLVFVRFKFGRSLEPVTIPATIGRGSGITPQTDIELLIMDIQDRPFENIRLVYDLFDYNTYGANEDPVTDPRNKGLFCRGLRLEYDPTFEGELGDSQCDEAGEICKYAYAKIADSGLYYQNPYDPTKDDLAYLPSEPQINLNTSSIYYNSLSLSDALKKCLPDNNNLNNLNYVLGGTSSVSGSTITYNQTLSSSIVNSSNDFTQYTYKGPFRTIDRANWEITKDALQSQAVGNKFGLFDNYLVGYTACSSSDPTICAEAGYQSYLFPKAGKVSLKSNIEHFSSSSITGTRSLAVLSSSGTTQYMDGCNLRVMNYDSLTNTGISSCNVTAEIELFYYDEETGEERTIDSNIDVKIQLIRPSTTDYEGKEVLYESMKTCSNSNACGADECCYNSRCWSKDIVSQCLEDTTGEGNLGIGQSCTSNYECSSLCCDQSKGVCAVHINTDTEQVLCSKTPGQQCVAKEWCGKESVSNCIIVKTGLDLQGNQKCALRCYPIPTFSDCRDGVCIPPETPAVPAFDPDNCDSAVDPPIL